LVILKKDSQGKGTHPKPLHQYRNKTVQGFIQECMGTNYNSFVQGFREHANKSPECIEFLDFISQYILCKIDPGFSPDQLLGDLRIQMRLKPFQPHITGISLFNRIVSHLLPSRKKQG
jgi:hypothetical protein